MSSSGSEDDAPEAVSFQKTKTEHENLDNQIKDYLKGRRDALKEKRKLKQNTLVSLKKEREEKLSRISKQGEKSSTTSDEEGGRSKLLLEKRRLPTSIVTALKSDLPTVSNSDQSLTNERNDLSSSEDEVSEETETRSKPKKMKRKIYDKLNIRVEALHQLENKRAMSAVEFKSRRFGKVHRESVDKNRIHEEKLIASGQLYVKQK